jgi:hypothetical protein
MSSGSSSAAGERGAGTGLSFGDLGGDFQNLLGNMNEQQLQMIFGNLVNSPSSNRSSNLSSNQ